MQHLHTTIALKLIINFSKCVGTAKINQCGLFVLGVYWKLLNEVDKLNYFEKCFPTLAVNTDFTRLRDILCNKKIK